MPDSIRIGRRIVKVAFLGWLLGHASASYAAFERFPVPVCAAGRGGSGVAMSDEASGWLNPASEAPTGISGGWSEPFGLRELGAEYLCGAITQKTWSASAMVSQLGDRRYGEQMFRGLGSRQFTPDLRAGLALTWHHLDIETLPPGNALAVEAGVQATLRPDTKVGAVWRNAGSARLSNYQDRLPEHLAAGVCFEADRRSKVLLDVVQESGQRLEIRSGLEAAVMKALTLRGGVLFEPAQYTLGGTIRHRGISVNYAFQWHRTLGATHFAGLDIALR
ncbi:MAG: hypothetical protein H6506_00570 [Calditrichaeota bacterium]|nr:hypothetical protein [Calditrichota bacterium]